MKYNDTAIVLDNSVDLTHLSNVCAMSMADLHELIEYGALAPIHAEPIGLHFSQSCVEPLRRAGIMRRDYDLDLFVVVILMEYLQRISQLESQLSRLKVQLETPH